MKIEQGHGSAVYHCISRTVNKEMLFDVGAKEVFRRQIWRVAEFSGVRILTYCVMTNHVHLLVWVPDRNEVEVTDQELVRRYRVLYGERTQYQRMRTEVVEKTLQGGGEEAQELRERLMHRMHDISEYMKSLKQRYTRWYNHKHGRVGTLWSERFKSMMVQEQGEGVRIVAAYIDLNPVRGGMVEDPKDYRYSGYGEAMGGSKGAREGLAWVMGQEAGRWGEESASYRRLVYCKGAVGAPGQGGGGKIRQERWREQMERGGRLPVAEAIRCRVRYFADGGVIGTGAYVQRIFESNREQFGARRRTGPRRMKGSEWEGLRVLRDLRNEVFG